MAAVNLAGSLKFCARSTNAAIPSSEVNLLANSSEFFDNVLSLKIFFI